ncbi:regulator of G protein signaling domain protein [Ceratobasidium sp. AG-Ba]|nr:regulator of G protein signaling domain protein [Ceratobasidium sp. AG-Ba]QRV87738.1 regulator of G protein signaling domain protein [Ceratobasidium sp. AG-Ba]QRW01912.1 regulator of G protein signaling domain protein [Ceratobasidium sp. AG-Ba]
MSSDAHRTSPPTSTASASHMMKVTKRGRPFLKDTLDLFATLIVSLDLCTHKQFFKSFPYSFTTDEAAQNLASLKFSQSNRGPDPRDPSRIVTTTTTTTFSMTREMAKAMSQHFMDARLIENAADRTSNLFKERGVYVVTPKGLHVLERFIIKNGINGDALVGVFESQPPVVTALFRRFVGRAPNYMPDAPPGVVDPSVEYHERAKGMPLVDVQERPPQMIGKAPLQTYKYCFPAISALEWLCDFTSIVGRDEAAEMAAHFVRFGYIQLVSDKRKTGDSAVIFTVRGSANTPGTATQGEFRCTAKAIYRITDEGRRVAKWGGSVQGSGVMRNSPNTSQTNLHAAERPSTDGSHEGVVVSELAFGPGAGPQGPETLATATEAKIQRRTSLAEKLREGYHGASSDRIAKNETNSERLKRILEEPALRSLFREFLRGNFCEENLSFWLEVQDLKRRFATTSTAAASHAAAAIHGAHSPSSRPSTAKSPTPGQAAMEKHHEALVQFTFLIYNTYLAPQSQCELNIDHALRNELYAYVEEVIVDNGFSRSGPGNVGPKEAASFNATQLQNLIRLYERIQLHVFRLMATDSLPKFVKTPRFKDLASWVEEVEMAENDTIASLEALSINGPAVPPGFETGDVEEVGRAYMTFSASAGEKAGPRPLGQGIAHHAPRHDKGTS